MKRAAVRWGLALSVRVLLVPQEPTGGLPSLTTPQEVFSFLQGCTSKRLLPSV